MKGLKAGGKALVIGADSDYGRETLVGRVVELVRGYRDGREDEILIKDTFLRSRGDPTWHCRCEGWTQPPYRASQFLDPRSILLREKFLMPLDDDDIQKEVESETSKPAYA